MKVREVMTSDVVTVTPTTPLSEVARLLSERRVSGAPVVDEEGRPIGVVSEGDLLFKEIGQPEPRTPLEWVFGSRDTVEAIRRRAARTAGEAMSQPAITIEPDLPLRVAAERMVQDGVNRLPVVTDDGRLVGIVTRADLVRAYLRLDREIEHTVREDILRGTMWLDPRTFEVESNEGVVRIAGSVDRRSTARIIAKLVGLVDGVASVRAEIGWQLDDLELEPSGSFEREPGAASLSARSRPPAMHR